MSQHTDQAIVLRLTEYSESSQIAALFTRDHGQVRLIAKGVKRGTKTRVAVGLELLEQGRLAFYPARGDAQLGTLGEWMQLDTFAGLRRDLLRLYGGLYAAERVTALTVENDPHSDVYDALLALLRELSGDAPAGPAIAAFTHQLAGAIGYGPNLSACVRCGRERPAGRAGRFSPAAGGLLCQQCLGKQPVATLALSAALLDSTPRTGVAAAWFELLEDHLTRIAGRPARTADTVLRLLKRGA